MAQSEDIGPSEDVQMKLQGEQNKEKSRDNKR